MEHLERITGELIVNAREVFADMAFLDVLDPGADCETPEIEGPWASIEVKGTVNGLLVLMLPLELKKTLIESIYSQSWDDLESDRKDDGLLEILNVFAGRFMSGYRRTDGFLKLSIPAVIFGLEDLPDARPDADITLDAEGTLFRMLFFLWEVKG